MSEAEVKYLFKSVFGGFWLFDLMLAIRFLCIHIGFSVDISVDSSGDVPDGDVELEFVDSDGLDNVFFTHNYNIL